MLTSTLLIGAAPSAIVAVGVAMFTLIVLALVLLILAAKKQLVSSGAVKITDQ